MPGGMAPFLPFTHHFGLQPAANFPGVQFMNPDGTPCNTTPMLNGHSQPMASPYASSASYANTGGQLSGCGGNLSNGGSLSGSAKGSGSDCGSDDGSSNSKAGVATRSGTRSSTRVTKRRGSASGSTKRKQQKCADGKGGMSPTQNHLLDMDYGGVSLDASSFTSDQVLGQVAEGQVNHGAGGGGAAPSNMNMNTMNMNTALNMNAMQGFPPQMNMNLNMNMNGMGGGQLDLDALLDTLGLDAGEEEALALQRSLKMYLK